MKQQTSCPPGRVVLVLLPYSFGLPSFPLSPELIVKSAKLHIKIYYPKVEKDLKISGTFVPFLSMDAGLQALA